MEHSTPQDIDSRTYDVMSEDATVTIREESMSLMDLANRFMPTFHMPEGFTAPEALQTWYEVVEGPDCYVIAYHGVWANEQHPVEVIHKVYKRYRKKRYGSEQDIEHVTVCVSKDTGEIDGIWYEDTLAPGYALWSSPHLYTEIVRGDDGRYIQHMSPIKDQRVVSRPVDWDGKDLKFGIATWSRQFKHLGSLPKEKTKQYLVSPQKMPLHYMTSEMFQQHKLAHRSTGNPGRIATLSREELKKKVPEYGHATGLNDELLFAV